MNDDRFGMPDAAFEAARQSHGVNNPFLRMGIYVPTREEVATMPPGDLGEILDLWMWESPTELIPSPAQIADVQSVLRGRPDAHLPEVAVIIGDCGQFLEGRDPEG